MYSTERAEQPDVAEQPGRPWAKGVGLLLLGLAVSASANALALHGETNALVRTFGGAGYVLGLVVAGSGVHRVLWAYPTARPRWVQILLTALVTLPSFAAVAIVLSLILTITQMRFQ